MNFILKPSLEQISSVKVAILLWNQYDIRGSITKLFISSNRNDLTENWLQIEDKVIQKISQLPLPELLKEKTLSFIKPIGLQILYWIQYHSRVVGLEMGVPAEFCWTSQGKIDRKKVAKVLIKDKNIDITTRYKLACLYCLENDIPELYNKVPENGRKYLCNEKYPICVNNQDLVVLYMYDIVKGRSLWYKEIERNRIGHSQLLYYQSAFEIAVRTGNKATAEYFLKKLTHEVKNESLVRAARLVRYELSEVREGYINDIYFDIFYVLLSQMNEEQQAEEFRYSSYPVLGCFLDWPRQPFFAEVANRMWNFLPESLYSYMLYQILNKVVNGYKDFDYQKLFREYWQQSPRIYKRCVLLDDFSHMRSSIVSKLFEIKNEINIKLIFQDATLAEKKEIIYAFDEGQKLFRDLMDREEWDLLKLLIEECVPRKDEMIKFKSYVLENVMQTCSKNELVKNKHKWDKFFCLLDDLICGQNKRKCIENDCGDKKFCADVMQNMS